MDVFISYQWDIQSQVKVVKKALDRAELNAWMDVDKIKGGDALDARMEAGVRAAKVVVICVTENYARSENCLAEVRMAKDLKKAVLPLRFEKGLWPPEGLGVFVAGKIYVDLSTEKKLDANLEDVVERLREMVEEEKQKQ